MVSSPGTRLPECSRRIFMVSPLYPDAAPIQFRERDGAGPEFAPIQ
jgi:hypothetical protein